MNPFQTYKTGRSPVRIPMKNAGTPAVLVLALLTTFAPGTPAGLFGPKGDSVEEKRQTIRKQRDEMLA